MDAKLGLLNMRPMKNEPVPQPHVRPEMMMLDDGTMSHSSLLPWSGWERGWDPALAGSGGGKMKRSREDRPIERDAKR